MPVLLLQLTGLWQSGADTNPPYSLSECDPRVVYTLWCTVGGALPGRGHLIHSSLAAKPSSSHERLVVLGWRRWEEGGGQEKGMVYWRREGRGGAREGRVEERGESKFNNSHSIRWRG